jgi:hypothetical protein
MDYFKRLPESLFDEILQFNEIPEIIKFSITSVFHQEIVRRNTINNCSKIQRIYNVNTPVTDLETWLFCLEHLYTIENIKLFKKIYKEYNDFLLPEFHRVFVNFIKLLNDTPDEPGDKNCDLAIILFNITKNNINLFTRFDINEEDIKFFRIVMKMLFQIYSLDEPFNIRDDLLSMLKKIIYDLINFLKEYDDLEECFVMEIIQDILFYSEEYEMPMSCNRYNKHIKIFLNFLENVIANNNLGYYFISPEEQYLSSHEDFRERYSDY